MVQRRLLQLVAVALFSVWPVLALCTPSSADDSKEHFGAKNRGSSTDVWGQISEADTRSRSDRNGQSRPRLTPDEVKDRKFWAAQRERLASEPNCHTRGDCPPPKPRVPGSGRVTIRDIASFIPRAPEARSEPDGFGIVDLPTNFVITAPTHIVSGTLLGATADVRFTATTVHLTHSDGATQRTRSFGASWAQLRHGDFTDTATSHRFHDGGSAHTRITVSYHADYRIAGGPWIPIDGTVTSPESRLNLHVYLSGTALVERTCNEPPPGPGCSDLPGLH